MRRLLTGVAGDMKHAVRAMARAPVFAITAVLTLAIGIGATTAIFSAVYAVVLRPLPFPESERLVRVYVASQATTQRDEASPRVFTAWRRESRSLEYLAAVAVRSFTLTEGARGPEQVTGAQATGDFFAMFGMRPALGRSFDRSDDRPGKGRVVVLSHRFWTTRFGADRGVIGRAVRLDGKPCVVIGVMPAAFELASQPIDLWTPLALSAEAEAYDATGFLDVIGRVRRGVSARRAQAELAGLTSRLDMGGPDVRRTARVIPYDEDLVGAYRPRLFTLLAAVAFVLLIACANVANLMLARGMLRTRELAIRAALGAGRGRLASHLFAESLVLAALGGVAGVLVAFGALALVRGFAPAEVPRLERATLDGPSLVVAAAASLACALVFGAVQSLRVNVAGLRGSLQSGGRSVTGGAHDRLKRAFVTLEVAFSLVLLVGAGLLIRTAIILERVDPGLAPANVWTGATTFTSLSSPSAERMSGTIEQIVTNVGRISGVTSAAAVSVSPFTGVRVLGVFVPEGQPVDAGHMLTGSFRLASPGLFRTLGVVQRDGRDFTDRDRATTPAVAIVNETFARLAWPGVRAVGRRLLGPGGNGPNGRIYREVIGVVGDTREDGLRESPRPAVYYPIAQASLELWESTEASAFIVARTAVAPLGITSAVQRALSEADRGLPLFAVRSMEQRMAELAATARFNTLLLATLGAVGLTLAGIGIYGVIAGLVGERRREIGVRMALGATPAQVVSLVVWQGLRPTLVGIAVGTVAAMSLTRLLASQLFGIAPTDVMTFVAVAGVLVSVAAIAAAIPAMTAARVPPREALQA